jgi:hypothetical protein
VAGSAEYQLALRVAVEQLWRTSPSKVATGRLVDWAIDFARFSASSNN